MTWTLTFDLAASLRRLKPEKQRSPLARRPDEELAFVDDAAATGAPLLLDTTVYVDLLQSRTPQALRNLLSVRQVNHSSVAVGELTHLFGRLDPSHAGTRKVLAQIHGVLVDIPERRLTPPSVRAVAEAGIVTGIVARLRGLPRTDRQPFMNDATLFLQAIEQGSTLLSANIADMDLIDQLVPLGRILLYRRV